MIAIIGIGEYDESRPFLDQPVEAVKEYLSDKINTFNDLTAVTKDEFNRPLTFRYEGEGIRIDSERIYKNDSVNYFIDNQTYQLNKI